MAFRYRLFREHKYLFDFFTELLLFTGKLDFTHSEQRQQMADKIHKLQLLLESHAHNEDTRILPLLETHYPVLADKMRCEHHEQAAYFADLNNILLKLNDQSDQNNMVALGYEFYLTLRRFFAENLRHFDLEEIEIMRALQEILTDEEIREIIRISYRQMSPVQMVHMMLVLFPHMNCDDRITYLRDIKDCTPEKFMDAFNGISLHIELSERLKLAEYFKIELTEKEITIDENMYYSWEEKPQQNT